MPFHELRNIKLGLLQDLDLSNVAVLDGEDAGRLTGNGLTNGRRNKFLYQGLQVSLSSNFCHVRRHLLADGSDLRGFGVARGLDLVFLRASEGNAKQSDNISIGSSAVNIAFDDGLLLSDQRAKLIPGHIHSVEIQQTVVSLHVFDTKLDLAVSESFVFVEVCQ